MQHKHLKRNLVAASTAPHGIHPMLAVLLVFLPFLASSQITIKGVEMAGPKIIVHYDLEDPNVNNEYLLNLYTSIDNFAAPAKDVKGDIGSEIKPGTDKKVEWSFLEEQGKYKGQIAVEIRGKAFIPFVKVKDFNLTKSYKRGNAYNLNWKPGSTSPINIELFKGNNRVNSELNISNNGSYSFNIPSKAKTGKNYQLKIIDVKTGDAIHTGQFKVRHKVPTLVKVLALFAVGSITYKLTHHKVQTIDAPPFPGGS
jgi:hypothetical protein